MGNLLASAARGVAIGHERDMEQKYELEKYDHQAAHAQTLEEMRTKNNRALQEIANEDAQAAATTRKEHELSMQSSEWDWKETDREDTQAHDIEMQLGDSYLANMKASGTVKSHGWSLSTEMVDVPNPDDPLAPPTSTPLTMMHSDDLGAFQQVGDKLYATGSPQQPKKQLTSAEESAETARLLENLGDWQAEKAFIDEFGYLPYIYAVRLRQSSDSGMSEYVRKNMAGRSPTGGTGGGRGGSGVPSGGRTESQIMRERMETGESGGKQPIFIRPDPTGFDENDPAALPRLSDDEIAKLMNKQGGGQALTQGATAEAEAEAPKPDAAPPAEAPKTQTPVEGVTITGDLSGKQAQEIADAIAQIKSGEAAGPGIWDRVKGGVSSWASGDYDDELDLYVTGHERRMMEQKYGKDWRNNPEAVAELRQRERFGRPTEGS